MAGGGAFWLAWASAKMGRHRLWATLGPNLIFRFSFLFLFQNLDILQLDP
jgi:hypothetical protein